MRQSLIVANWKMNKNNETAINTIKELLVLSKNKKNDAKTIIAPSFVSLLSIANILGKSNIELAAQNMHFAKEGAYTGEVSAEMLISANCKYVILGHSERRQFFKETDKIINKKIKTAIVSSLNPIFCIGETKKEREAGKTFDVLDKQLKNGLKGVIFSEEINSFIIAYEPVWAIGTGLAATNKQIEKVHNFLNDTIKKYLPKNIAKNTNLLYGGSVNPNNIKNLMHIKNLHGVLVGGASLDAKTFFDIIQNSH